MRFFRGRQILIDYIKLQHMRFHVHHKCQVPIIINLYDKINTSKYGLKQQCNKVNAEERTLLRFKSPSITVKIYYFQVFWVVYKRELANCLPFIDKTGHELSVSLPHTIFLHAVKVKDLLL